MFDPETMIFVGIFGVVGAMGGYITKELAKDVGSKVDQKDMMPAMFPYPPIPKFLVESK